MVKDIVPESVYACMASQLASQSARYRNRIPFLSMCLFSFSFTKFYQKRLQLRHKASALSISVRNSLSLYHHHHRHRYYSIKALPLSDSNWILQRRAATSNGRRRQKEIPVAARAQGRSMCGFEWLHSDSSNGSLRGL